MRFRSELLQPPREPSEATLTRIYDVYMTPDGIIEGEQQSIPEVLERGDATLRKGAGSKPTRGR